MIVPPDAAPAPEEVGAEGAARGLRKQVAELVPQAVSELGIVVEVEGLVQAAAHVPEEAAADVETAHREGGGELARAALAEVAAVGDAAGYGETPALRLRRSCLQRCRSSLSSL